MTYDDDIQKDLDEGNIESLAMVAQDLRNTMSHVNARAWIAAYRRKAKAERGKASEKRDTEQ